MRLLSLDLVNIGPFDEAHLDFRTTSGNGAADVMPVTFVTGENGTGKSIVIDAIRAAFGPEYAKLSRTIEREGTEFEAAAVVHDGTTSHRLLYRKTQPHFLNPFGNLPTAVHLGKKPAPAWFVDYWSSDLDRGSFAIDNLAALDLAAFLRGSMQGHYGNQATTQFICHLDYLRDSRDPQEKRLGEMLYQVLQDIVEVSLIDGRFSHVARARLEPMFEHRGRLIDIDKLSAGSLYLIQRLLGLLGSAYACHMISGREGDDLLGVPGLLLIDEAENHLHPKWQKRFIPTIRKLFPNVQIIAATHSPFILASVHGARVYVCRAEGDHCTVTDVSDEYADRPIDEILLSPAFAETQPFSQEITDLLERRRAAIQAGDEAERKRIEEMLLARNREYFDYFQVDDLLQRVTGGVGR